MKRLLPASLLALSIGLPAFAGEVGDFETRLRAAYGDYRTALFATNMGKAPESTASLGKFAKAWVRDRRRARTAAICRRYQIFRNAGRREQDHRRGDRRSRGRATSQGA